MTHSGRKAIKGDGVGRREPEQELARLHAAAVYDTAQFEEKQNNRPHATKRQIVGEYPDALRESGAKFKNCRYSLKSDSSCLAFGPPKELL